MALSVAQIVDKAMTAVAAKVTGAIIPISVIDPSKTGYDHTTATRVITETSVGTGRMVVASTTPASDIFPDYVIGPGEQIAVVESLSAEIKKGQTLRSSTKDFEVLRVQDVLQAGVLYYVAIR